MLVATERALRIFIEGPSLANPLKPLPKNQFDFWQAQHLLVRAGFGGTPEQARALAELGLEKAVAYLVEYDTLAAPTGRAFDANIMRPPTAEERALQERARRDNDEELRAQIQRARQDRERGDREQLREMQKWWLQRMIETGRPLEEKLTLFWHGHFATGYRTIEDSFHMQAQNEFFRANANGNFRTLVHGILHDPAMLEYLDSDENRRRSPNENLARELMELFTLGEGHAYSERDIKEGARALTGWTFRDDAFFFDPAQHDPTSKSILGRNGEFGGLEFADIILAREECASFICRKLYRFFVNDAPTLTPTDLLAIAGLAKTLRNSRYELKPVLTQLFQSSHFYAPENRLAVVKSPMQLMVQSIRSLRCPSRELASLISAGDLMGQQLMQPPSVKGWDGGRAWINTSTLFVRHNVLVYLLTGHRPEIYDWMATTDGFDAMHLVTGLQRADASIDTKEAVVYLLRFALGAEPRPERVAQLLRFLKSRGDRIDNDRLLALLALISAMPEYQLC